MKRLFLILFLLSAFAISNAQEIVKPEEKEFTEQEKNFIIKHIGGIWTIEKRVFPDGTVLTPPDVKGYLLITRDFWSQTEAQSKQVGEIKPFAASYFGTTDLSGTRSIEKVYLFIRSIRKKDKTTACFSTNEMEQKTWLRLGEDSVTQIFDRGGSVTMKNDRFTQERNGKYRTYWKRIKKPREVF